MGLTSDYSILAVDDTDIILDLLRIQLEHEGYSVTTAGKGERAKKLINSVSYDLILLDIEMPEITGIELLQYIKETEKNKATPVVMLTAQNDPANVNACLSFGAKDYILKPFNMISVKDRIWRILQKS